MSSTWYNSTHIEKFWGRINGKKTNVSGDWKYLNVGNIVFNMETHLKCKKYENYINKEIYMGIMILDTLEIKQSYILIYKRNKTRN